MASRVQNGPDPEGLNDEVDELVEVDRVRRGQNIAIFRQEVAHPRGDRPFDTRSPNELGLNYYLSATDAPRHLVT